MMHDAEQMLQPMERPDDAPELLTIQEWFIERLTRQGHSRQMAEGATEIVLGVLGHRFAHVKTDLKSWEYWEGVMDGARENFDPDVADRQSKAWADLLDVAKAYSERRRRLGTRHPKPDHVTDPLTLHAYLYERVIISGVPAEQAHTLMEEQRNATVQGWKMTEVKTWDEWENELQASKARADERRSRRT